MVLWSTLSEAEGLDLEMRYNAAREHTRRSVSLEDALGFLDEDAPRGSPEGSLIAHLRTLIAKAGARA
jgi:hypothetical protein